jgi:hypothetical protein
MAKEHFVEMDFVSDEGLRCVGLALHRGHRCGYVGVPRGHVLYGIEYSATLPEAVSFVTSEIMENAELSYRGVIPLFVAALTGVANRLDCVIDVHGSLTYSGSSADYPIEGHDNLWWFGFDCAHSGDGKDESIMTEKYLTFEREMQSRFGRISIYETPRSAEYVKRHLKMLARQLWYINSMVGQSMLPAGRANND